MAQAPKVKALTVGADAPDWFSNGVLTQLNSALSDTANALDRQLTPAENLSRQVMVLSFTTGATVADSFPQQFNCTLSRAPEDVRLAQKQALGGGSFAGATDVANWFVKPGNVVVLREITGLNANTKYQLTLVVT